MPPANKAKAAGISASSFLDLKAELSKHQDEFSKKRLAGESRSVVGGVKRPDKKPTVWARQNSGVKARAARDVELEAISKPTLESARAALERKAKIYDKLKRGKTGGLSEGQYSSLLVDFDSAGPSQFFEPNSDEEDESLTTPRAPVNEEADPIVEYEDEFGRMRTARRSEVPRELLRKAEDDVEQEEEPDVIYYPNNHFPVYEHDAKKQAEIIESHSEANNPLSAHYDASQEIRAKGAGFYQFSTDEETRKAQMEELKSARDETFRARQDAGAVDVRPGEAEGMGNSGAEGSTSRSRAQEKRKREIEERRKLVEAKRRKLKPGSQEESPSVPPTQPPVALYDATKSMLASQRQGGFELPPPPSTAAAVDPFATLESQALASSRKPAAKASDEADMFLESLGLDLRSTKR